MFTRQQSIYSSKDRVFFKKHPTHYFMYFITANEAKTKYTGWLIAKAIMIAMLAIATPIPKG